MRQDLIDQLSLLSSSDLANLDISKIAKELIFPDNSKEILEQAGKQHYRLLAWIASQYNQTNIFDIGTHFGSSSLALSYNINNTVISYDIMDARKIYNQPPNCTYKIGDFRDDESILLSSFIFIDVDPHDGIQEANFHQFFIDKQYSGLVLWDDIHLSESMNNWWNSIEEKEVQAKLDLTSIGHWAGTGAIIYG